MKLGPNWVALRLDVKECPTLLDAVRVSLTPRALRSDLQHPNDCMIHSARHTYDEFGEAGFDTFTLKRLRVTAALRLAATSTQKPGLFERFAHLN